VVEVVDKAWRELGRLYMERAKRLDPWRATLHGIAHTQLRNVNNDREAIEVLHKISPSPGKTSCPLDKSALEKLAGLGFHNPTLTGETLCDKVKYADEWLKALKSCNRRRLMHMKMEGVNVYGLRWKGIDMSLLDAGCENPVIDIHMARYMAREDPEFLRALGLEKYDPSLVAKRIKAIHDSPNPAKYDELWERAVKRALSEGVPPGEWHVAIWLKERFSSMYPELSEEAKLELARRYVEKLFS